MNPWVIALVAIAGLALTMKGRRPGLTGPLPASSDVTIKSEFGPQWVPWVTPTGIHNCLKHKGEFTLPLYSAVCVKILDGDDLSWWENDKVAGQRNENLINKFFALSDAAQCARWGWGYHYCYSPSKADSEGRAAAVAAKKYKCLVYSCNIERYWIAQDPQAPKSWKGKSTVPKIRASAMAFLAAFREEAPGIRIHVCPAAWPVTRLSEKALDASHLALWDGLDRMLFGSTANDWQQRKFDHALKWAEAAKDINPAFDYVPLFPSGDNLPTYAGSVAATVDIETAQPTFYGGIYYGNLGGPMWSKGNASNPPWSEAIPELRSRQAVA
jgi:hypothetical protein